MLTDLGSRDDQMVGVIRGIREKILEMGHVSQELGYECVLMQGSGTFTVESVVTSVVPKDGGRMLIFSNGAYGERLGQMAVLSGISHKMVRFSEKEAVDAASVAAELAEDSYSHVAVIHHETTAGVLNPIAEIGEVIRKTSPDTTYIVDSMSAFGAYDVDMRACGIDYLVSSANKNIEGVPGFAFALCKRSKLLAEGVNARSVSLDLLAQWKGLEGNGQFRFTPPTHALLAFWQALLEHEAEGGVAGRGARYQRNFEVLKTGMDSLGFKMYVPKEVQGFVISTFLFPDDPKFDFARFYSELAARGLVIYPGKLTEADCFRMGSIGRLFEHDMSSLVLAVGEVLAGMGVAVPVKQIIA